MKETVKKTLPGIPILFLLLLLLAACIMALKMRMFWTGGIGLFFTLWGFLGFIGLQPNKAAVVTQFGKYCGTVSTEGLRWLVPVYGAKSISLRVRNFETKGLKVNDHDGNPIEIAAVVVWKVVNTADALFQVESYENYVEIQSEAALRNLATAYSYDSHDPAKFSLRANTNEVSAHLKQEIHDRLKVAGVEVVEARISHLAYAPEIAAAMLQRQQASAIIAARTQIVEGAVSMVHMALEALEQKGSVTLDEERKAAMVSNLLVVLCGERAAQPVLNTGTLHH